jgi:SLT domain-containing protein
MQQLYIQSNNSLPAAKRAFEDFAQNALGLTKKQADTLWQQTLPSLQKTINNLHGKTVDVGLTTSGAGQIIITGTGISTRTINTKTGQVNAFGGHTAKGGYINVGTTPTADDVLLFGSKGELMVPANIVNAGLVDHLRGLIPGFATGGIVPSPNISAPVSAVGNAESQIGAAEVVFGQAAATAFSSAALAAVKAAAATLAAGVPVAYSKIAGVTQWEPDVLRALAMLGLSAADLPTVMAQILTESGGNPNAINLTDINAQQGDPSRGLLQTIMTTFQAYRSPALSANIYDPMANIYAALNYAIHRYGNPGWLSVLGHGHGYATGGFMPAGHSGVVGEAGIEAMYARPGGGVDIVPLGGGGKTITQYFQYYGTQYPTAEMTAQQRRDMAMALAVAP